MTRVLSRGDLQENKRDRRGAGGAIMTDVNGTSHTFDTVAQPTWCPGCGNFGIHKAIKNAFTQLGLVRNEIAVVTGIGCSGNTAQWYNTLSLIHISEPTRLGMISYAVFCLKK